MKPALFFFKHCYQVVGGLLCLLIVDLILEPIDILQSSSRFFALLAHDSPLSIRREHEALSVIDDCRGLGDDVPNACEE
jgi:hypothetical protein